jgi:hypothetical protein
VQFFSLSPDQVKRTSPLDGVRAMATVLAGRMGRFEPRAQAVTDAAPAPSSHAQVR